MCEYRWSTNYSHYILKIISSNVDMYSLIVSQLSCTVLALPSLSLVIAACETRYTKEPLYEYRCVSDSEVLASKTDSQKCHLQCLRQNCCYINYNPNSDQCEFGLGQCESLAPAVGVLVNVFWQPRDVCLHWGSYQEPGRMAVGRGDDDPPMYAGRIKIGQAMVIGKFLSIPNDHHIWVNNEGHRQAVDYGTDTIVEVLTTIIGYPLFWVPYTSGKPLPDGAVVGGYLIDGKATYVARKQDGAQFACGYYNTES